VTHVRSLESRSAFAFSRRAKTILLLASMSWLDVSSVAAGERKSLLELDNLYKGRKWEFSGEVRGDSERIAPCQRAFVAERIAALESGLASRLPGVVVLEERLRGSRPADVLEPSRDAGVESARARVRCELSRFLRAEPAAVSVSVSVDRYLDAVRIRRRVAGRTLGRPDRLPEMTLDAEGSRRVSGFYDSHPPDALTDEEVDVTHRHFVATEGPRMFIAVPIVSGRQYIADLTVEYLYFPPACR